MPCGHGAKGTKAGWKGKRNKRILCLQVYTQPLLLPNRNLSGRGPSILLRKTVLSLKHPTGVFVASQTQTCRGEAPPSCCARPFCRLKAPLGLSLLRSPAQTRTCRGGAPPSCCARPFCHSNTPRGCLLLRKRELLKARNFRQRARKDKENFSKKREGWTVPALLTEL